METSVRSADVFRAHPDNQKEIHDAVPEEKLEEWSLPRLPPMLDTRTKAAHNKNKYARVSVGASGQRSQNLRTSK